MTDLEYWKEAGDRLSGTKEIRWCNKGATGVARNWEEEGDFFDLCHGFSLPLMLKLSVLFSQLWYKLKLHLLSCFGRRLLSSKTPNLRSTKLSVMARTNCQGTLSSVNLATYYSSPYSSLLQTFEQKFDLHLKGLLKFFHWLELSKVLV